MSQSVNLQQQKLRRTKWVYGGLIVLTCCAVNMTSAMYSTYVMAKGLDGLELNSVRALYFVLLTPLEVLGAIFADVYGRRKGFVISCALNGVSMAMYATSSGVVGFACAEVAGALGAAFANGAFVAWFVHTLNHHGMKDPPQRIFNKVMLLNKSAALVAGEAGALLADVNQVYPWLAGALLFSVALLFAVALMREDYRQEREQRFEPKDLSLRAIWEEFVNMARAGMEYVRGNRDAKFCMAAIALLYFAIMAPNMMWQPLFVEWAASQSGLGGLWVGISVSLIIGTLIAPGLLQFVTKSERKSLLLCQWIIAAGIIVMMVFASLGAYSEAKWALFVYQTARGAFETIQQGYFQRSVSHLQSERRATITSFERMSHHLGSASGLLLSGLVWRFGTMTVAGGMMGVLLFLGTSYLWLKHRHRT